MNRRGFVGRALAGVVAAVLGRRMAGPTAPVSTADYPRWVQLPLGPVAFRQDPGYLPDPGTPQYVRVDSEAEYWRVVRAYRRLDG